MLTLWLVIPLALNVAAIRVPITNEDQPATDVTQLSRQNHTQDSPENPIIINDVKHDTTDSYNVQKEEQTEPTNVKYSVQGEDIVSPARYLLPPRQDAEVSGYLTEPEPESGDWTPMVQDLPKVDRGPPFAHKLAMQEDNPKEELKDSYGSIISISQDQELPRETFGQWFNPRLGDESGSDDRKVTTSETVGLKEPVLPINIPSRQLEPPLSDSVAINFNSPIPASELQPPLFRPNVIFRPKLQKNKLKPIFPTISLEMKPPTPELKILKKPTTLYPKKYLKIHNFKPIPIPVSDFQEGDIFEVPKAKPMKYFKPVEDVENEQIVTDDDEKKIIKFQQAEEKRKFQEEEDTKKQQEFVDARVTEAFASPDYEEPTEQETSETGVYNGGRNSYAAPLGTQPPVAEEAPAPAERTEFRMHGLQGPHSYKFGYDTGKGKNRQFRYEERSNDGYVKGHYGYMDKHGKLQVVNYDAHPEHGFHAEGPFGKV